MSKVSFYRFTGQIDCLIVLLKIHSTNIRYKKQTDSSQAGFRCINEI